MKTNEARTKSRMKNWRAVYAAFASGQKFVTQKAIRSVAPIDHNLPYILIRLGYITAEPPYQIVKKTWDFSKVNSMLRAYYRDRKPYQFRDLRQDSAKIAPENNISPKTPVLPTDFPRIKDIPDADIFAELKRRGWDIPSQLWKNTAP